jgi:DNA-binding NarL/FixJ family response regulator
MAYNIVLADDHPLIRQYVKRILADGTDLEVVGEAGDGEALLELLQKAPITPDLIILDMSMPRMDGVEAARRIKRFHPGMSVLILTMHAEREYLRAALAEGVAGYLQKEDACDELLPCIETIRKGDTYLSHRLTIRRETQSA